jgi:hypothetical protein
MYEPEKLSFGERFSIALGSFLKAVLRLILILIAAGILAGLVYFGFVFVYQNAVLPAQENTSRIMILETKQAQNQDQLNQRLEAFQLRLNALENQRILDNEVLSELQVDQLELQTALQEQDIRLMQLDELNTELQALRIETEKALELAQENQVRLDNGDPRIGQLQRELTLLRVAALLNRSRLSILQSNYGLAQQEIELARVLLVSMEDTGTPEQLGSQAAWIGRLDSALANLPEFPVIASDDLETAWKMIILEGLPANVQLDSLTFIMTSTPTLFDEQTLTPAAELTGTPNELTATPTVTPTMTITPSPTP